MVEAALLLAAKDKVTLDLTTSGVLALVAGVLILLFPRLLNYLVAAYLIFIGIIEIFNLELF
jgi:Protein of unknown function (DUF3096)